MGYRGYDELGIEPQFPFGHGLSYTTFEYQNLHLDGAREGWSSQNDGGEDAYMEVGFEVTNTGARAGAEVAQVYVGRLPAPVPTPPKQLAGFARVTLEPGERRRVAVVVTRRSVSYWDTATARWITPRGDVPVYVGSSSRDIRLSGTIVAGR